MLHYIRVQQYGTNHITILQHGITGCITLLTLRYTYQDSLDNATVPLAYYLYPVQYRHPQQSPSNPISITCPTPSARNIVLYCNSNINMPTAADTMFSGILCACICIVDVQLTFMSSSGAMQLIRLVRCLLSAECFQ